MYTDESAGVGQASMAKYASGSIGAYQQPSQRQQLQQKKDALESELAKVNAALAALDAHPDLEQFIDTINRAR